MNKTYRQGQILRLIRSRRILTQDSLAHELAGLGITTTQVTLSRDLKELGLVKTAEGYRQVDSASAAGPQFETVAAEFLTDARMAQNLLVLKTAPGHASSLAITLDHEDWPEVVGTVAGDDTVLVVTADNRSAAELRDKLLGFIAK